MSLKKITIDQLRAPIEKKNFVFPIESPIGSDNKKYKPDEFDDVVDNFQHLWEPAYRLWHITQARKHGVNQYYILAKQAEAEGKNPAKYFSWLLKQS